MSSYAKGKHAFGFCDRTGFRYPLRDLVRQIEDGRWNGLLVGRDVVDQDQPQLKLGDVNDQCGIGLNKKFFYIASFISYIQSNKHNPDLLGSKKEIHGHAKVSKRFYHGKVSGLPCGVVDFIY